RKAYYGMVGALILGFLLISPLTFGYETVTWHFGLAKAGTTATLEQLGKHFGVTKERVRQIEKRALAHLREVLAPSLVDVISG
ncbi:MAG: hypothetical protein IIB66_10575, partial [Proteobacteria bacterium]|nr:hypothetical protein [Pseudomonadota bacterium]